MRNYWSSYCQSNCFFYSLKLILNKNTIDKSSKILEMELSFGKRSIKRTSIINFIQNSIKIATLCKMVKSIIFFMFIRTITLKMVREANIKSSFSKFLLKSIFKNKYRFKYIKCWNEMWLLNNIRITNTRFSWIYEY